MQPVDRLLAIEGVRLTKATYWYSMDMKDWATMATLFTDDAIFDSRIDADLASGRPPRDLPSLDQSIVEGDPGVMTGGGKAIAHWIGTMLSDWTTVHHGHAPIIEIDSEDEARAIWPLFDYIDDGTRALQGYGHYHERYRRQPDGRWLISYLRLTRLRGDGDYPQLG